MTAAVLAVLMVSGLPQGQAEIVAVSPEVRSLPELAAALSVPGRHVAVAPETPDRVTVVALQNRPWSEARPILEKALDVAFHAIGEGEWRIEPSPEALIRNAKLYNAFLVELGAFYSKIFDRYRKLSHGQIPPDANDVQAQIDEQVRSAPPRAGSYEGSRLFACNAPWDTVAALALLYGTATSDVADMKITGPTLYHMMRSPTMKRLIGDDLIDTGDAYFWRNWQDLPDWVRWRATAHVRNHETELAEADLPPQEKRARLDAVARGTAITHRLSFDPLRGAILYEFSVLGDPTKNSNFMHIEGSFKAAGINGDILTDLPVVDGSYKDGASTIITTHFLISDNWYDSSSVRALHLPMDAQFLKTIADSAEIPDDAGLRSRNTAAVLASAPLAKRFALTPGSRSLAQTFSDFAAQTGTEVVAWIPLERDHRLKSGSNGVVLSSIAPWLTEDKQETQGQVAAWTAEQDGGVLMLRDEWSFLDEKYAPPLAPILTLGRSATNVGGSEKALKYEDLVRYAHSVTPAQNAEIARLDPELGVSGAARIVPFVNFFEKLPPQTRAALFAALKKDGQATLHLGSVALQTKLGLVDDLRRLCAADERANRASGALHHSIFHPWANEFVKNGDLRVYAQDMKVPNRNLYRLSLSLTVGAGQSEKDRNKTLLIFSQQNLYDESSGPIELPE